MLKVMVRDLVLYRWFGEWRGEGDGERFGGVSVVW